nr:transposase [Stutzerimonas stutzeri]
MLHTGQQNLGRHLHVHALVAGGALTAEGQWRTPTRGFLFPVKALSKVFRGRLMDGLKQTLTERDTVEWRQVKTRCYQREWVVYAKQPLGGPAQVLDYLGRYTHRVAISNERIVAIDQGEAALRVRVNDTSGKRRILRLPGSEFIERFLTHVLPKGFKRIRHYGLLGPAHKAAQLAAARTALQTPAPQAAVVESVTAFLHRVARLEWLCSPPVAQDRCVSSRCCPPGQADHPCGGHHDQGVSRSRCHCDDSQCHRREPMRHNADEDVDFHLSVHPPAGFTAGRLTHLRASIHPRLPSSARASAQHPTRPYSSQIHPSAVGGSVQQSLSAALHIVSYAGLAGAADKRCSLGAYNKRCEVYSYQIAYDHGN